MTRHVARMHVVRCVYPLTFNALTEHKDDQTCSSQSTEVLDGFAERNDRNSNAFSMFLCELHHLPRMVISHDFIVVASSGNL